MQNEDEARQGKAVCMVNVQGHSNTCKRSATAETYIVENNAQPGNVACTLQELLDTPNEKSPAQSDAFMVFTQQLGEYRKKVRKQAEQYPPPN